MVDDDRFSLLEDGSCSEEVVISSVQDLTRSSRHRKRGAIILHCTVPISGLVCALCVLIVLLCATGAVSLLLRQDLTKSQIPLESFLDGTYAASTLGVHAWAADGSAFLVTVSSNGAFEHDLSSLSTFPGLAAAPALLPHAVPLPAYVNPTSGAATCAVASVVRHGDYLLGRCDQQKTYRHSSTHVPFLIFAPDRAAAVPDLAAAFSPTADVAVWDRVQVSTWLDSNNVALVIDDGLQIFTVNTRRLSPRLSPTNANLVEGSLDWVYEEEVWATDTSITPSSDGSHLAWLSLDTTGVPTEPFTYYDADSAHTLVADYTYSKVGEAVSAATVKVLKDATSGFAGAADVETIFVADGTNDAGPVYIDSLQWVGADLFVRALSRDQRTPYLYHCPGGSDCAPVAASNDRTRPDPVSISGRPGWLQHYGRDVALDGDLFSVFAPSGSDFPTAVPSGALRGDAVKAAATGDAFQIAELLEPVTIGGKTLGLVITTRDGPQYRTVELFDPETATLTVLVGAGVNLGVDTSAATDTTSESGTAAAWYSVLSQQSQFGPLIIVQNGGPRVPFTFVCDVSDCAGTATSLVANADLRDLVSTQTRKKQLPTYQLLELDVTTPVQNPLLLATGAAATAGDSTVPKETVTLTGSVWYPPGLSRGDKSAVFTYPLLVQVYGGPGSQKATAAYGLADWLPFLAAHGVIVATIDPRGTGFRGEDWMFRQRGENMGVIVGDDILAAIRALIASEPSADASRVGVYGWSFGGYSTGMVVTRAAERAFSASGSLALASATRATPVATAVSVAPVTHWRLYDSPYTERFAGVPWADGTAAVYDTYTPLLGRTAPALAALLDAAVPAMAESTGGISAATVPGGLPDWLIVHGLADDNVAFANSATLTDELVAANVPFKSAYYTNRDHSINVGVAEPLASGGPHAGAVVASSQVNARGHLYRTLISHLDRTFGLHLANYMY
jgi:hypothetical protein